MFRYTSNFALYQDLAWTALGQEVISFWLPYLDPKYLPKIVYATPRLTVKVFLVYFHSIHDLNAFLAVISDRAAVTERLYLLELSCVRLRSSVAAGRLLI